MAEIRIVKVPDWIIEASDSQKSLPLVFDSNKTPPKREPIDPFRAANFLDEIVEVCHRHGLWLIGDYADLVVTRSKSDQTIRGAILDD